MPKADGRARFKIDTIDDDRFTIVDIIYHNHCTAVAALEWVRTITLIIAGGAGPGCCTFLSGKGINFICADE